MNKKWLKRGMAGAWALLFAVGSMAFLPVPAKQVQAADASTSFSQEVYVVNKTNADDNINIAIPDMVVSYRLEPNIYSGRPDTRYIDSTDIYPSRTTDVDSTNNKYMVYNKVIESEVLTTNVKEDKIEVSTDTFFKDNGAALTFQKQGIYRYTLTMTGIYTGSDALTRTATEADRYKPLNTTDPNLLTNGTSLITAPAVTTLLCDVLVDQDKNISAIGIWKEDGSTKANGFVNTADGGIQYNVYNIEVSSDYVGNTDGGAVASALDYTVSLTNLPDYLLENVGTPQAVNTGSYDMSGRELFTRTGTGPYTYAAATTTENLSTAKFYNYPTKANVSTGDAIDNTYYEKAGDVFTATTQNLAQAGTDYYLISDEEVKVSPVVEGWFEENDGVYSPTEDTELDNNKTYYHSAANSGSNIVIKTDGESKFEVGGAVGQTVVYKGSMAPTGTAIFVGVPVDTAKELTYTTVPSKVASFGAILSYARKGNQYETSVFSAYDKERIQGVTQYSDFKDKGYAGTYTLANNANGISKVAATEMTTGITSSDNNIRYVVMDPEGLVLVGVVMNYIPGIIMVGVAITGALAMIGRRRIER